MHTGTRDLIQLNSTVYYIHLVLILFHTL